jgi:hypothetical protein
MKVKDSFCEVEKSAAGHGFWKRQETWVPSPQLSAA